MVCNFVAQGAPDLAGNDQPSASRGSFLAGFGLSFVPMAFATFGYIPRVAGALLQEGIVAVILDALRARHG